MVEGLRKKRVLVTGSAGFLGKRLCQRLIEEEQCDVVGIDNFSFSKDESYRNPKFLFRKIDITQSNQVEELFKEFNFDLIFHLAAVANPRTCKENFDVAFNVNVAGTKNVLINSPKCDMTIFMSSAAVYGEPLSVPIDEKHPRNGNDPYAITKIMGEDLCFNFVTNYKRNISIVRNFNTFGIGQTGDYIIPTLIRQALSNKKIEIWNSTPVRDLTYVDDTIEALFYIAANKESDVYNVGSGKGIRIGELAQYIKNNIDPNLDIIDLQKPILGSPKLIANNTKLSALGWKERIGFDQGLYRTIQWFKSL